MDVSSATPSSIAACGRAWTCSSAFNGARITISGWELADDLTPSNPQAHFGAALVEKLAPVFAAKSGAAR